MTDRGRIEGVFAIGLNALRYGRTGSKTADQSLHVPTAQTADQAPARDRGAASFAIAIAPRFAPSFTIQCELDSVAAVRYDECICIG